MDEPTSSLSQSESENLFAIIRGLKQRGVAVVYISHRLAEVEKLSDRVYVLRDGKNAGELSGEQIRYNAMIQRIVGRELNAFYTRNPSATDEVVLRVRGLRTFAYPDQSVDFELRAGEIVGLAGLVGAGRTELLTTLFGIESPLAGEIEVRGNVVQLENCHQAIRYGLALVPEDRKGQGVVLPMSVRENTSLASLATLSRWGIVDRPEDFAVANRVCQQLGTKTPHVEQPVKFLSGGNQQKVVLGKWLARGMRVLLMDEPTRGVDVGAKQEIYRLMDQLAQTGVAILFVSSDMEEVLGMSDRMLVMHEGQLTGRLARHEFSEEAVIHYATGALTAR